MSRAKRGESNLLAVRRLLRRCAPRNDTGCDMASKAHVPPATLATSEAQKLRALGQFLLNSPSFSMDVDTIP